MQPLSETNPQLVSAAWDALAPVMPVGPQLARETTFVFDGNEYWTKMTVDSIANTIERWDVFPANQSHLRW